MRHYILGFAALGLAVALVAGGCGDSTQKRRDALAKRFVACLPDSLDDRRVQEILGLLDVFWARADEGEVYEKDVHEIESRLEHFADAGRIGKDDLVYLMAQVGYFTYRKDPRYNLPEGIVDHPTLNPDAALIQFNADSTGGIRMYYRVPGKDTTKAPPQGERPDE